MYMFFIIEWYDAISFVYNTDIQSTEYFATKTLFFHLIITTPFESFFEIACYFAVLLLMLSYLSFEYYYYWKVICVKKPKYSLLSIWFLLYMVSDLRHTKEKITQNRVKDIRGQSAIKCIVCRAYLSSSTTITTPDNVLVPATYLSLTGPGNAAAFWMSLIEMNHHLA